MTASDPESHRGVRHSTGGLAISILVRFAPDAGTTEQYDDTIRRLEANGRVPARGSPIPRRLRGWRQPAGERDLGFRGAPPSVRQPAHAGTRRGRDQSRPARDPRDSQHHQPLTARTGREGSTPSRAASFGGASPRRRRSRALTGGATPSVAAQFMVTMNSASVAVPSGFSITTWAWLAPEQFPLKNGRPLAIRVEPLCAPIVTAITCTAKGSELKQ